jgi:hypothetical protein
MSTKTKATVLIPVELFRDLVWLQAFYALQLNAYDGGGRRPVEIHSKPLQKLLTEREIKARVEANRDPNSDALESLKAFTTAARAAGVIR